MSFHDVIFPTDISYGSKGGPVFSTNIVLNNNGYEQRNINWQQSRIRYNISYGVRTTTQLAELQKFFRARLGKAHSFRFKDWLDYKSCDITSQPQATDIIIAMGDGDTTSFQLIKQYQSGDHIHKRIISKPVNGSVKVALDNVEQPESSWEIDYLTGIITFDTAPAQDAIISCGFEFHLPVRFDTDYLETSLDSYGIGSINEVICVEVRE